MSKQYSIELVKKVNSSEKLKWSLTAVSYVITVFSVLVFAYMLWFFVERSVVFALGYLITLGAPFLLVSVVRRAINAPRPYEIYDFFDTPPKNKKGNSFPSRHCFSIFAIGTLCLFVFPVLGVVTLAFGALLCFCRVALGLHFVRDVLCGALVGVMASLIGGFILMI